MWKNFTRRSAKAAKFGWKHRSKCLGVIAAAAFAYVAVYALYVGTVGLVQVIVIVTALTAAGLAKHHDNMKLRRHLADTNPKPSFRQQREWARNRGAGPSYRVPEPPGQRTVYVRSHRNDGSPVDAYTRAAPGRVPDPEAGQQ